jgi:hypothetical protein
VRTVLHLVRGGVPPKQLVAERDWLVYLQEMQLSPHGEPPIRPGQITYDQLVALTFTADLVVTW